MKKILEIKNLTKYYGKNLGIEDLSLELNEGEIFGFIGPNGAGKSTTIRSIMNLINKTKGKVLINGEEFTRDNIELKSFIGYLPSEIYLYDDYTVKEMLDYHEKFYKHDTHTRRCELSKIFKLDETKKIEDLSLGNLKKLGIVLALMHSPKLLILDEPSSGLDPIMQDIFYNILRKEKEKGTTILYSTHILSEVSKICDRVGIVKEGHLLKIENIQDMKKKNVSFVTITAKKIDTIIKDLKIEKFSRENNTIKFENILSADDLIKKLAQYKIENILIESSSLEDSFMEFYR